MFVVDHCHASGVVRGLLCHRCNKVLGAVEDSVELLASLAAYLKAVPVNRKREP